MGLKRFELLTPSLSEKCSNQLSYSPKSTETKREGKKDGRGSFTPAFRVHSGTASYLSLRKEVIQPHLPVRLPCYDFTLLTKHTFDSGPPRGLAYRLRVSSTRMV